MATNQLILEWQEALPSFGISYTGPKDGQMNHSFIEAMMTLEAKYEAYGHIFTGSSIKMSVDEAKQKFLNKSINAEPSEQKSSNDGSKELSLKKWESFLSQDLPVVGKLYQGDLAAAGKNLEAAIGKFINKSMNGVIWNDDTRQFNTTTEDIKKALELIRIHKSSPTNAAKFTLDQRVMKMSQMLLEKK